MGSKVPSHEKTTVPVPKTSTQDPLSPLTKRLSEVTIPKSRVCGNIVTLGSESSSKNKQPTSPKQLDEALSTMTMMMTTTTTTTAATSATTSLTTTPTTTPAPSPSFLDKEGYEKLQPGASILHYASLDLPESSNVPSATLTPSQESFNYVEIDFAKLKQT